MKPNPWIAWLYSLGLAGACLTAVAGCGGGDVPDASDSAMLTEGGGSAEPALPAPAPAAAPEPAAAAAPAAVAAEPAAAVVAQPGDAPPQAPAPAVEAAAAPVDDAEPAAAAKPENSSATAELLAIATAAPEPVEKASGPGAQGGPGMAAGADGMMPGGPGGPQSSGGPDSEAMRRQMMEQSMANAGPGAASAMAANERMPGAGSGSGGLGGDTKEEGDTKSPDGAVKAFLSALKSKDRDRLAEATALRAASAAEGGKHRDVFARIIDSSISDTELDQIASQLEDFQVSGANQPKSTGQLKVTTKKTGKNGGWLQRTFTVRREKKGWGVLDLDAQVEFHGNGRRTTNQPGGQFGSGSGSGSGSR